MKPRGELTQGVKSKAAGVWTGPEESLTSFWRGIPDHCQTAMIGAFVSGLVCHMFMLVNKLPNGDDLSELYHDNSMIGSGRWLDILSKGLASYYSIPWATGLICLVLLAVSCALICSLTGIRRKSGILAAGALLSAFPTMASYFSYMYYMDLYMLTLLFSVWAVWLARRRTRGFLPGALLIALALGNYQAYLGVTAVLCLLVLIRECLNGEKNTGQIAVLTLRFAGMGALGVALYFLILRGIMRFFAAELSAYQGISGMGTGAFDFASLAGFAKAAFGGFLGYFYRDEFFTSPVAVKFLYSLLLLCSLLWISAAYIRRMAKEGGFHAAGIGRCFLLLAFLAMLPVAYQLIRFMAPDAFLHSLMQPQYALFWLMPLMFFEWACPTPYTAGKEQSAAKRNKERQKSTYFAVVSHWILLLSTAGITFFFFLTVNISYLHLHLKYEIAYATELRILDRIEALPEYRPDTPVCVSGTFPNSNMSLYPYHTADITAGLVGINGNLVHHYYNYNGFYLNYLGRQMNFLREDDARKAEIVASQEVRDMPLWPKEGSVAMVDGVAVVRIN